MNWFKKAQNIMLQKYQWNRFGIQYPGVPWKYVVEMKVGEPTNEEIEKIKLLGLYEEIIDPTDKRAFPDFTPE